MSSISNTSPSSSAQHLSEQKKNTNEGSLMRLFKCDDFASDPHYHFYYLVHKTEAGIQDYLVNLLYKRQPESIQFYLPQLCQLALIRFGTTSVHRFLLDQAAQSMPIALKLHWGFQATWEDRIANVYEAAKRLWGDVEMSVVNSKTTQTELKLAKLRFLALAESEKIRIARLKSGEAEIEKAPVISEDATSGIVSSEVLRPLPQSKSDFHPRLDLQRSNDRHRGLRGATVTGGAIIAGTLSVPGSRLALPNVYAELGDPVSASTLCPHEPLMDGVLQPFLLKQKRCDNFNLVIAFTGLLVQMSCLLATEPERSMRIVALQRVLRQVNDWLFERRCAVAVGQGSFQLTGAAIPLEGSIAIKPSSASVTRQESAGTEVDVTDFSETEHRGSTCSYPLEKPYSSTLGSTPQILRINEQECKVLSSRKRAPYLLIFETADLDEDLSNFVHLVDAEDSGSGKRLPRSSRKGAKRAKTEYADSTPPLSPEANIKRDHNEEVRNTFRRGHCGRRRSEARRSRSNPAQIRSNAPEFATDAEAETQKPEDSPSIPLPVANSTPTMQPFALPSTCEHRARSNYPTPSDAPLIQSESPSDPADIDEEDTDYAPPLSYPPPSDKNNFETSNIQVKTEARRSSLASGCSAYSSAESPSLYVYDCIAEELRMRGFLSPPSESDPPASSGMKHRVSLPRFQRSLQSFLSIPPPRLSHTPSPPEHPYEGERDASSAVSVNPNELLPAREKEGVARPSTAMGSRSTSPPVARRSSHAPPFTTSDPEAAGASSQAVSFTGPQPIVVPSFPPPSDYTKMTADEIRRKVWGEFWEEKVARLREASPYGGLRSWRLHCVLVKGGDDLRQELLACQLISQMQSMFESAGLPLWLRPYDILATSSTSGILDFIPNTASVDALKKAYGNEPLNRAFEAAFFDRLESAKRNFVYSHAAYCIATYLLNVKDRHNANLLIDTEGHIMHIDFGYMLSNSPGNVNFESAPFKLTQEYLDVMDGEGSQHFVEFRELVIRGFLELRKHSEKLLLLVQAMLSASRMPCLSASGPEVSFQQFKDRFHLSLSEKAFLSKVVELIDNSINNWRSVQYDVFQQITNGIS